MKKFGNIQSLKGFNRKKKKGATETDGSFTSNSIRNGRSSSGLLQNRTSTLSRLLSPRSFKGRGKTIQEDTASPTMSPVSIDYQIGSPDVDDVICESSTSHHCGPVSMPAISPTMAAIEAATEEMFRTMELAKPLSDDGPAHEMSPKNNQTPNRKKSVNQDLTGVSKLPRKKWSNISDKPERKWTMRGLAALMTRKVTLNENTDLPSNWLIDFNDLTVGKTIGHSSFGTVRQGTFNGTNVAVKTIEYSTQDVIESFQKEAELNCKLRHPNIVLFMGISLQPTKVCLVTELMARGNVRELLLRSSKKEIDLDLPLRLNWALDTARGMAYLHSLDPPMIHRDLKTTNLLVDKGMNLKICDFGLSRIHTGKIMSAVGTVQFSAPEVLSNEIYNESSDLFSFGTVMWELYTRSCVFDGMSQMDVYTAVMNGNMPKVDEKCDKRYSDLMMKCWTMEPSNRPSFREAIECLSQLADEYETTL